MTARVESSAFPSLAEMPRERPPILLLSVRDQAMQAAGGFSLLPFQRLRGGSSRGWDWGEEGYMAGLEGGVMVVVGWVGVSSVTSYI